ncbi:MAG: hypothetical protein IJ285_00215 [Clostridia bacterium]|nr:hypothetical protein [Clostridia bacterium]
MNFTEFRDRYFGGETNAALEGLAKEYFEFEFPLTGSFDEWRRVYSSLSYDLNEEYKRIKSTLRFPLTAEKIISSVDGYKKQQKIFAACIGLLILVWLLFLIISKNFNMAVFLAPSLCIVGSFFVWAKDKSRLVNAFENRNFYVVMAPCTFKAEAEETEEEPEGGVPSVCFAEYGEYRARYGEYSDISYGDEHYLVIADNSDDIQMVYSLESWIISENDFYEKDGQYYPVKL